LLLCNQETNISADDTDSLQSSRIIADVFATITAVPSAGVTEAELIAMETLFDAHHPAIS